MIDLHANRWQYRQLHARLDSSRVQVIRAMLGGSVLLGNEWAAGMDKEVLKTNVTENFCLNPQELHIKYQYCLKILIKQLVIYLLEPLYGVGKWLT